MSSAQQSRIIEILIDALREKGSSVDLEDAGVRLVGHGEKEGVFVHYDNCCPKLFSVFAGHADRDEDVAKLILGDEATLQELVGVSTDSWSKGAPAQISWDRGTIIEVFLDGNAWLVEVEYFDDDEQVRSFAWMIIIKGEEKMQEFLALKSEEERRELLGMPLP